MLLHGQEHLEEDPLLLRVVNYLKVVYFAHQQNNLQDAVQNVHVLLDFTDDSVQI